MATSGAGLRAGQNTSAVMYRTAGGRAVAFAAAAAAWGLRSTPISSRRRPRASPPRADPPQHVAIARAGVEHHEPPHVVDLLQSVEPTQRDPIGAGAAVDALEVLQAGGERGRIHIHGLTIAALDAGNRMLERASLPGSEPVGAPPGCDPTRRPACTSDLHKRAILGAMARSGPTGPPRQAEVPTKAPCATLAASRSLARFGKA